MSVGDGYLPLNTAAKQHFVKWLNSRTNEHHCPVCLKNDWSVGDYFLHGVLFSPHQPPSLAGGSAYPIVFWSAITAPIFASSWLFRPVFFPLI